MYYVTACRDANGAIVLTVNGRTELIAGKRAMAAKFVAVSDAAGDREGYSVNLSAKDRASAAKNARSYNLKNTVVVKVQDEAPASGVTVEASGAVPKGHRYFSKVNPGESRIAGGESTAVSAAEVADPKRSEKVTENYGIEYVVSDLPGVYPVWAVIESSTGRLVNQAPQREDARGMCLTHEKQRAERAAAPKRPRRVPAWKLPREEAPAAPAEDPAAVRRSKIFDRYVSRRARRNSEPSATEAQVQQILSRRGDSEGCWATIPTTEDGIRALRKSEASLIIAALDECR